VTVCTHYLSTLLTPEPPNQSPPNFAQTSPPTQGRFLTRAWPRQTDPYTPGYTSVCHLSLLPQFWSQRVKILQLDFSLRCPITSMRLAHLIDLAFQEARSVPACKCYRTPFHYASQLRQEKRWHDVAPSFAATILQTLHKNRKTLISQHLDKNSKIWWVTFLASIWGVYMQNFSLLASKLWKEFEVTDTHTDGRHV